MVSTKTVDILDVGSGDAYVANEFTKAFDTEVTRAHCVDIGYTPDIMKVIHSNFKNKNLNLYSNLESVKTEQVQFVTLLDVIEHVPEDVALLSSIVAQPYISDSTHFIITVPAYQSLFSQHDVLLHHYRRYTLSQLKNTITKSGLETVQQGYFFSSLLAPRILQLLLEKTLNKNKEPGNLGQWNGGRLKTKLIQQVLVMDYTIGKWIKQLGINFPGLSCYMICKKRK